MLKDSLLINRGTGLSDFLIEAISDLVSSTNTENCCVTENKLFYLSWLLLLTLLNRGNTVLDTNYSLHPYAGQDLLDSMS